MGRAIVIEAGNDGDYVLVKALAERLGMTVRETIAEDAPWWEGIDLSDHLIAPSE